MVWGDKAIDFRGQYTAIASLAGFPGTVYSNFQFRREKGEKSKFSIVYNRDKASLDIFWLRDESLEELHNLSDPDVLAQEIVASRLALLGTTPSRG